MGTVHFSSFRNGWRIFSRTVLVESCVYPTSSLVFQDERSEQKQGAGVNRILILLASLFLVGTANSEDETEVIYLEIPSGFEKGFEDGDGSFSIQEWVPSGETVNDWGRMITLTVATLPNLDPVEYFDHMADGWKESCPEFGGMLLHEGSENNYPVAIWFLKCPDNPITNKPEFTYIKGISGNDAFYTVQLAFALGSDDIDDAIVTQSMEHLRGVFVCDGRKPEAHPCE